MYFQSRKPRLIRTEVLSRLIQHDISR